jgi:hypothetical protein
MLNVKFGHRQSCIAPAKLPKIERHLYRGTGTSQNAGSAPYVRFENRLKQLIVVAQRGREGFADGGALVAFDIQLRGEPLPNNRNIVFVMRKTSVDTPRERLDPVPIRAPQPQKKATGCEPTIGRIKVPGAQPANSCRRRCQLTVHGGGMLGRNMEL